MGIPIDDYLVRLDELKEYGPGKSVSQMLHATGRLIFPLEVNQQAMSMVVLYQEQEKWLIESYGGKNQIQIATDLRKQIAEAERKSSAEVFQVRIPALQLMFIGFKEGMDIYLSPVFDMERYGFEKGRKYPAEQVMEKLVEAARQHNGLPT